MLVEGYESTLLPNLTPVEITRLLSGGKAAPRRFMIVQGATGLEKVKLETSKVGQFEGRVGTTVRSRKGRTYRKANGSRRYIAGSPDVVAYKV